MGQIPFNLSEKKTDYLPTGQLRVQIVQSRWSFEKKPGTPPALTVIIGPMDVDVTLILAGIRIPTGPKQKACTIVTIPPTKSSASIKDTILVFDTCNAARLLGERNSGSYDAYEHRVLARKQSHRNHPFF